WLSVDVQIELAHFLESKRPGTAPAKDRNLMAGLIDPPIAVESLGQRQRRRVRGISRDHLRFRLRTETVELRLRIRRRELDDLQAADTVRDIGEERCIRGGHDHVAYITQRPAAVEQLSQPQVLRALDVD